MLRKVGAQLEQRVRELETTARAQETLYEDQARVYGETLRTAKIQEMYTSLKQDADFKSDDLLLLRWLESAETLYNSSATRFHDIGSPALFTGDGWNSGTRPVSPST